MTTHLVTLGRVEPTSERLSMYGAIAEQDSIDWGWVHERLQIAGTYWVIAASDGHPHPRPVWGVWHHQKLWLSIGSPTLRNEIVEGGAITAHLGDTNDVVILEGTTIGSTTAPEVIDVYNKKYRWQYTVDEYGPLTGVAPDKVIAWQSAGLAGRDGFRATGRWTFAPSTG